MAPEQIAGSADRRTDVFAASIVLWELLAGRRLFSGASHAETLSNVLAAKVPPLHSISEAVSPAVEELVMCGLDPSPNGRFESARAMDRALHRCIAVASTSDVAEWLLGSMGKDLEEKASAMATALENREVDPVQVLRASRIEAMTGDIPSGLSAGQGGARATRGSRVLALVLLAATFGGVLVWTYERFAASKASVTATQGAASSASPAAVPAPEVPSAQPPVPGAAQASGETAPAVSLPHGSVGSAPGPRPAAKRSKCDPPYWVDERGQHFKKECL